MKETLQWKVKEEQQRASLFRQESERVRYEIAILLRENAKYQREIIALQQVLYGQRWGQAVPVGCIWDHRGKMLYPDGYQFPEFETCTGVGPALEWYHLSKEKSLRIWSELATVFKDMFTQNKRGIAEITAEIEESSNKRFKEEVILTCEGEKVEVSPGCEEEGERKQQEMVDPVPENRGKLLRKPYPIEYDEIPYPKDHQAPVIACFTGDNKWHSAEDHLERFLQRCPKIISNDALMIKQFSSTLVGQARKWFMSLKNDSIKTWSDTTTAFVARFGRKMMAIRIKREKRRCVRKAKKTRRAEARSRMIASQGNEVLAQGIPLPQENEGLASHE